MAFRYRITINRDLINGEQRGIDLLEPGGWVVEPIPFDIERGLCVKVAESTSRWLELYLTDTVIRLRTLSQVDIEWIEFWTREPINLNLNRFYPPQDWGMEFVQEDE